RIQGFRPQPPNEKAEDQYPRHPPMRFILAEPRPKGGHQLEPPPFYLLPRILIAVFESFSRIAASRSAGSQTSLTRLSHRGQSNNHKIPFVLRCPLRPCILVLVFSLNLLAS